MINEQGNFITIMELLRGEEQETTDRNFWFGSYQKDQRDEAADINRANEIYLYERKQNVHLHFCLVIVTLPNLFCF